MPGQNGSAPEAEEEGSSQSSGKGSRATTAEQLIAQQAVRPRQSSIHQMTDNIVTSEALEDQAIHDTLDTIMCDNAKDFPFNFGDPRQQLSWEAQSFDFTAECLPMHSGAQIFPTLSVKNPFDVQDICVEEILPKSHNAPLYNPYSSSTSGTSLAPTNPSLKRAGDVIDRVSTSPTPASPVSCACFQQNTELLWSLKASEYKESASQYSIDSVLSTAREASKPWQSLIECRNCAYSSDQEGLLITLMTIRIVLLRLQQLLPPWSFQASDTNSVQADKQQQQEAETKWPNYNAHVTVGAFHVTGKDRILMLQMLLLTTVRKIKAVMVRFKEMLDRKKKVLESTSTRNTKQWKNISAEHGHATSNLMHVQQMLQSLMSFVQTLERALEREQLDHYT